jgi:hypothetical protein
VGRGILWTSMSCRGSHLRPWKKLPSLGGWSLPLLTRHRVREHGEVVVARRLEHRETGTAVLRGHRDRTGAPPPPPPPHRRRDLGFGLEPPPPPYPCLVIRSSCALRQAWTSRRTELGKKGKLASCAGEEVESGELRRDGQKWRGGGGTREGEMAGRERSAGGQQGFGGEGAERGIRRRRCWRRGVVQRVVSASLGRRGTGHARRLV